MRRIGRPIPPVMLTAEERGMLEGWARRPTTAQATALRARLILGCAARKTNTAVARELRVTKQTVGKWRSRFVTKRLDGLLDEPRPGAPRTVTDTAVERVVTLTLELTSVRRRPDTAKDVAGRRPSRVRGGQAQPWAPEAVSLWSRREAGLSR